MLPGAGPREAGASELELLLGNLSTLCATVERIDDSVQKVAVRSCELEPACSRKLCYQKCMTALMRPRACQALAGKRVSSRLYVHT